MELESQKVDIVDLNKNRLPYDNESFDIVTATEIIEHLENPRSFLRDISRILKPQGICVLSTPNVLSLNSRLRYLFFGFFELFGPLPIEGRTIESCSGHISPISYFYLYHAMKESGFNEISFEIDKYQRSGMVKLALLHFPIQIKDKLIKRKERLKFKTIDKTNLDIVNQINSPKLLLGRTIILIGKKNIAIP
jgi:ubiquinone/menaquinone biosynthesis C-methylase UbiE